MDTSQFDPETFLSATTTEPLEKAPPLPVGRGSLNGDYMAVIGAPKIRPWQSRDGTKSGLALDVPLNIQVPDAVQSELKIKDTVQRTHGIFLDITAGGTLDNGPGANRSLRAYREATDMNKPGEPFNIRMLEGRTVRVKLKHETYEHDGIREIVDRVDGVAKV